MSPRGPIARWTPELDAILIEHFPTMPIASLSFLLGRTIPALKVRAHKLRLRRDPEISRATRQAAGIAGYAAAEKRRAGEPVVRKPTPQPPPPPARPRPAPAAPLPDERAAHVKRLRREAVDTLVAHGLEDHAAELACHLIAKGLVPALKFEMPA